MTSEPPPAGPPSAGWTSSSGSAAYQGSVRLTFCTAPEPWPRPGPVTDAADPALARLRRRVVEPVVAGLLAPGELESVEVSWGVDGDDGDVWVRVVAVGEEFRSILTSPEWGVPGLDDDSGLAERLADQLEDWVCETRFAWGEQRRARYTLPGAP